MTATQCRECGSQELPNKRAAFCGENCRKAWHNRRKTRGAELYDLLMSGRYERTRSTGKTRRETGKPISWESHMQSKLARLALAYRQSDQARRGERQSWNVDEALERIPLEYNPSTGDGR